jgi:hypothetical protein
MAVYNVYSEFVEEWTSMDNLIVKPLRKNVGAFIAK